MTDTLRSDTATIVESGQSATSWAAIVAGGVAAAALTLVLLAFGSGMGFSAVSPWSNVGVSASTFKLATGVYLIIVSMLSSTIGGYIAGRLRTKWVGLHSEEVLFRDTAHGFLAWAFAGRGRVGSGGDLCRGRYCAGYQSTCRTIGGIADQLLC